MSAFNLQNEYRPNSFPDPPAPYVQYSIISSNRLILESFNGKVA